MGSLTGDGESPVYEMQIRVLGIRSICEHEEFAEKIGGPPSKPKYYLMTDSGEVL